MGLFHDTLGGLDDFEGLAVPDGFGETITAGYDADLAEAVAAATAAAQADIGGIITAAVTEAVGAATTAVKAAAFDAVLGTGDEPVAEDLGGEAVSTAELPDADDGDLYDDTLMTPATASLFTKKED